MIHSCGLMENEIKISIITVVYNGASTIEQTILSVLNQSYKNIEYIIVDGMSTDGTQQIIEKYLDSIACYIREKDDGLYDAMNKGIQAATGDIIGIINSDDWYNDGAFEKVVAYFAHNDVDVVYGNVYSVYPDGSKSIMMKKPLDTLWYQMAIPHSSVFIKKTVYEKYGLFDLKYRLAADHELLLRLYSKGVRFGFINEYLASFLVDGLSMTRLVDITEEHRSIFVKYHELDPNKEESERSFKQWYRIRKFCISIEYNDGALYEMLCNFFQQEVYELIIFGTGIWGNRCYKALNNYSLKITFTDNDSSKWGTDFQGIPVVNPVYLCRYEGLILIASENAGKSIKSQLIDLNNKRLKFVTLAELIEGQGNEILYNAV